LGCTVVSTIIRDSSDGLIASGLGGDRQTFLEQRLQPILAHAVRQRVIDDRSNTSRCSKNSSPQKY
jgi:hypothetical protein